MKKVRLSPESFRLMKKIVLTTSIAILIGLVFFGIGYWVDYSFHKDLIDAGRYIVPTHLVAIIEHWMCGMLCSIFPIAFLGLSYYLLKFVFKLKMFNYNN